MFFTLQVERSVFLSWRFFFLMAGWKGKQQMWLRVLVEAPEEILLLLQKLVSLENSQRFFFGRSTEMCSGVHYLEIGALRPLSHGAS